MVRSNDFSTTYRRALAKSDRGTPSSGESADYLDHQADIYHVTDLLDEFRGKRALARRRPKSRGRLGRFASGLSSPDVVGGPPRSSQRRHRDDA